MLPIDLADSLWQNRYERVVSDTAYKYSWLEGREGRHDDMKQEIALHVWIPAIQNFDMQKVRYTDDLERAFNSYFQMRLTSFLMRRKRDRNLGQGLMDRSTVPLVYESGEEAFEGTVDPSDLAAEIVSDVDYRRMMDEVDPEVEKIIRFMVDWMEVEHFGERFETSRRKMWSAVQQQFGFNKNDVIRMLAKEPAFVQYSRSVLNKGSLGKLFQ